MKFVGNGNFKRLFKPVLLITSVILVKLFEAFVLLGIIHWLLKKALDPEESLIYILIVFIIITPFTFIVWKQGKTTQEAKENFSILAENSLVGIYMYEEGKFTYVNRRFLEKTGYERDEIIGQNFHKLVLADDHSLLIGSIQDRLNGKSESSILQVRAVKKDQSLMDIEIYGTIAVRDGKSLLMGSILDISERKRNERLLNELAFYDPLTGLANRRQFEIHCRNLFFEMYHQTSGVLLLDLDGFKQVNDSYGHEAGDFLLKEIAIRLLKCVRKEDIVARFAGDEFLILLPNTEKNSVIKIAQRIIEEVNKPFRFQQKQISASTSIGVAFFPEHGADSETLIKLADGAMYEAKKQGKNKCCQVSIVLH
jgi:diguanylate cyclase (GGDEF)-like protein/PAS domain S-box-containing protein